MSETIAGRALGEVSRMRAALQAADSAERKGAHRVAGAYYRRVELMGRKVVEMCMDWERKDRKRRPG